MMLRSARVTGSNAESKACHVRFCSLLGVSMTAITDEFSQTGETDQAVPQDASVAEATAPFGPVMITEQESDTTILSQNYQIYSTEFPYDTQYLRTLSAKVQAEIAKSYERHQKDPEAQFDRTVSDFHSLDAFIFNIPDGSEKGVFYGIDVGGTNMRIVRCRLQGNGATKLNSDKYEIAAHDIGLPKNLMDKDCPATVLFEYIAEACKKMIDVAGDQDRSISMGFTFSFPTKMKKINEARVMKLGKSFETGSNTSDKLEGKDCVAMMNAALATKRVNATVTGCLNDTTGTLLAAAYDAGLKCDLPAVKIGMIIGTGFNTCLVDETALKNGYQGTLINLESGGLTCTDHAVDKILDAQSSNPGAQNAEKKISGLYLGEVVRLSLLNVLGSDAPAAMKESKLETGSTAEIFACEPENVHAVVKKVMKALFDWDVPTDEHCEIVAGVVDAAWNRSAAIVAAIIAGCAQQTGYLHQDGNNKGLSVGVDGSVYCKNKKYQDQIKVNLIDILGQVDANLVHIIETSDGSGKGAAMLACANDKH